MIKIWKQIGDNRHSWKNKRNHQAKHTPNWRHFFSKAHTTLLPFLLRTPTPLSAQGKQSSTAAPSLAADSTSAADRRPSVDHPNRWRPTGATNTTVLSLSPSLSLCYAHCRQPCSGSAGRRRPLSAIPTHRLSPKRHRHWLAITSTCISFSLTLALIGLKVWKP